MLPILPIFRVARGRSGRNSYAALTPPAQGMLAAVKLPAQRMGTEVRRDSRREALPFLPLFRVGAGETRAPPGLAAPEDEGAALPFLPLFAIVRAC